MSWGSDLSVSNFLELKLKVKANGRHIGSLQIVTARPHAVSDIFTKIGFLAAILENIINQSINQSIYSPSMTTEQV